MKIEILKDNFKKALSACERITRKITTLPVLQNVLIKTEGNFLELTTTNLETTIRWWVLSKIEEKGKLAAPATFLSNLINLTVSEKIHLREENNNLVIESKEQKTQIQGQDTEDFPVIPSIKRENPWQIPSNQLVQGLQQISDIPSSSQIRPEISGIYFNLKKKTLKIVGTDSFRLAEKTIKLTNENKKDGSFILPQSTAKEIISVFSQEEGRINVYFDDNQVLFELFNEELSHPSIHILSRVIEGEYPNYAEIIPKKHTTEIQVEKELLDLQIKQAGLFSGKVLEVKLSALKKEGKLKLFSQSAEIGKNESYFSCKIEGEDIEVSFNYKFLLDGLNNIKSSEVLFELSGQDGPGVLKPVGDESYLYILMPIKAN